MSTHKEADSSISITTADTGQREYTFAEGFRSLKQEQTFESLSVKGKFPAWLNGSLIRTGPALYELEHQNYNHWFDGLALLHKFSFQGNQVSYANRFLKSRSYKEAMKDGKVSIKEFATDPCRNIFQKAMSIISPPQPTDNGNINIINYNDVWLATSETPLPIVFDTNTLKTLDHFDFEDELDGQIEPAHPHYGADGSVYNYLLKFSMKSRYYVFCMPSGSKERSVIAEIEAPNPSYMHSMGLSERYIILTEFPKIVKPLELAFGDKPLIENYHWKPELGTKYQVIDRKTGEVQLFEGEPVFAFHHVNAFEQGDQILVDFVAFEDASVLDALYLDELRSNEAVDAAGYLTRATIDLKDRGKVKLERLSDKLIELPRIYYEAYNTKPYRYVYGAGNTKTGNFLDDITKIDTQTGAHQVWYREDCYPSEPVFIPRPGAQTEDDGILLSVVLDTAANHTFLLALDARSFEEIARATTPKAIPFGFHGQYISG